MKSRTTLPETNEYWREHCDCTLKKTATQAVFGDGNPHADVVFIGEAPGKKEDLGGRPFIGAAGTFLSELLDSIGLKREDIYITNVVKYRPPNNRDPLPEEKAACAAWLHEELAAVSPKLIVLLGRHAMNSFFPELKISDAHGTVLHKKRAGMPTDCFLPLYHPAAALYNGGLRQQLFDDFQEIPNILRQLS